MHYAPIQGPAVSEGRGTVQDPVNSGWEISYDEIKYGVIYAV